MRAVPSKVCIVSEFSANHLDFSIFDPAAGKRDPLTRMEGSDWYLYNWTLSPDGSTIALAKYQRLPGPADIRLLHIAGGKERVLTLKDWTGISSLDWPPMAAVSGLPPHRQPAFRRS